MPHISFSPSRSRSRLASLVLTGALAIAATGSWLSATAQTAQAAESARSKFKIANQKYNAGAYAEALVVIEEGLKLDAKHQQLLLLKASTLMKLRNFEEAYAAFKAFFAAGGKSKDAQQTMEALEKTILVTLLELTAPPSAANVAVTIKDLPFCSPGPTCVRAQIPGQYTITAEAEGFEPWSGEVTAVANQTVRVELGLREKPSLLTVKSKPEPSTVTVDGAAFTSPAPVPAGAHQVTVALKGHATAKREVTASLGKPVELLVELVPNTLASIVPAEATLLLDGQPVALDNGGLTLPPGKHILTGKAPGYREGKVEIPAKRAADYQVVLELKKDVQVVDNRQRTWTPRRKIAVASAGLSLAALGAGVYLGLDAKKLEDDSYALCPMPTACREPDRANDLIDRADSRALQANIAYGVAGAAAVGAVVLWITGKPETQEPRVAVTPRFAPTSSGSAVTGVDLSLKF